MSKVMILSLCVFSAAALKLQQEPEFDVTDALYNEECGNRFNYKCWRKGGHSLDKEEAAYIVEMFWARPTMTGMDNDGEPANGNPMEGRLKVTWNKAITPSGTPILKVNKFTATNNANADINFPHGSGGGDTKPTYLVFKSSANAVAIGDKWQVKVNAIKVDAGKTIKNAGKSKDADVSNLLPDTGPLMTGPVNTGNVANQARDRTFDNWNPGYQVMDVSLTDVSLTGACTAVQQHPIANCFSAVETANTNNANSAQYFAFKDADEAGNCVWCDATGTSKVDSQSGFKIYRLPHNPVISSTVIPAVWDFDCGQGCPDWGFSICQRKWIFKNLHQGDTLAADGETVYTYDVYNPAPGAVGFPILNQAGKFSNKADGTTGNAGAFYHEDPDPDDDGWSDNGSVWTFPGAQVCSQVGGSSKYEMRSFNIQGLA